MSQTHEKSSASLEVITDNFFFDYTSIFYQEFFRCFEESISLQKSIKEDFFIIPYAIVEIGLLHVEQGKNELAINCLEDAKKNYTGYSLESRLHFRIHTALSDLKGNPKDNDIHE